MRLLYKSEPIKLAPAASGGSARTSSLSEGHRSSGVVVQEGRGGLLTAVSSTHTAIGCAMHAGGCTVVVGDGVEAHVLGVRDAGLELGHDVVHTLLEKGPGGRQVSGRWRHWVRRAGWRGRGRSGHVGGRV